MDNLTKLRYWTFKILPLVYDDSLSYYEVLAKVTNKVNELVDSNNTMPQAITDEITKQLDESYATNINNKINSAVNTVTENANNQIDKLANEVYAKLITAIATDEGTNTFTKDAKSGGELIFLNNTLYKVTAVMPAGTNYIIGTNIIPVDISEELKTIKEKYISSNNEHWNERSTNNYNAGIYLFWKDILYVTTKDIKTNDILFSNGNNQNLRQVTLAKEISDNYNEMHEMNNNLQVQINGNDNDINKLQTDLTNEVSRATNRENIIDGRISNIVAQSGNDNTEIVDARIGYDGTKYDTLGTAIRTQVSELKTAFETFTDGEYELVKGWYAVGGLINGVLKPELNYRVSETEIISYDKKVTLLVASGFRIDVHVFVNGTFSYGSGWKTDSYTIPANTSFKLTIAKVTEDKSVVANVTEFMSAVTIKSIIGDHTEILNSISEIDLTNLSPKAEAVTTVNGNLNESTGYFGTVESGKTYTFSAYNNSDKSYGVTIRINNDGWKKQGTFNPAPNSRFSYTFTANANGDISLSAAYSSVYDPLFSEIQLQEGTNATEYIPYHDPTALDKVARNSIGNALDTVKEILLKSGVESIAHQGGNIYGYPQNTIPNFIECAKNGWRNVEFDVRWTSDNVPVISHDDSRTIYGTSTTISIANATYSDLQNMQFFADATIKIPSLYDTLDTCKIYGLKPHIELKTDATTSQITTIINYLKRKKLFEDAFITSFQLGALTSVIGIDSNTNVLLNVSSTDSIDELIASDSRFTTLLNHAGKTAFAFSHTLLSKISNPKSHLAEFSDKGGYVCIYTLDTDALVETYISMCDYITSNALRVENVID